MTLLYILFINVLQVSSSDTLPTIICVTCCNRLDDFYEFFRVAAVAQIHLQNVIGCKSTNEPDIQVFKLDNDFDTLPEKLIIDFDTFQNESNNLIDDKPSTSLTIDESDNYSSDVPDKLVIKSFTRKDKVTRKIKASSTNSKISEVLQNYPWYCTICESRLVKSLKDLIEHFKTEHDSPPVYRCIHCGRQYDRYRSFTKHFLQHEDPKKFE